MRAQPLDPPRSSPLRAALEAIAGAPAGSRAVVAFDLDSTLLDNRPRQARIVREYGRAAGIPELEAAGPEHWVDWDLRATMVRIGIARERAEALYRQAKAFWLERFFTSEYCADDVPIRGAVAFLGEVVARGALVAYVTGRHEAMREGTVDSFRRAGFPLPDGAAVHLLMKPRLERPDDAWKVEAQGLLAELGRLVAAFDNEPAHANAYRAAYPEAVVVHLQTDHSGRPIPLLPGIVGVPHFAVDEQP